MNPPTDSDLRGLPAIFPAYPISVCAFRGAITVPQADQCLNGSGGLSLKRQHQCLTCFKTFGRPSALKKHFAVHTKVKAFECPDCHKHFTLDSNRKRHMHIACLAAPDSPICNTCNTTPPSASPTATTPMQEWQEWIPPVGMTTATLNTSAFVLTSQHPGPAWLQEPLSDQPASCGMPDSWKLGAMPAMDAIQTIPGHQMDLQQHGGGNMYWVGFEGCMEDTEFWQYGEIHRTSYT